MISRIRDTDDVLFQRYRPGVAGPQHAYNNTLYAKHKMMPASNDVQRLYAGRLTGSPHWPESGGAGEW